MKIMVMGESRHGKDTVCEILENKFGLTFRSSSDYANEKFLFGLLQPVMGYRDREECFEDRVNLRYVWYKAICQYVKDDKTRLARELFQDYDVYCGCRSKEEFLAAKEEGLFDYAIWVDASDRVGSEIGADFHEDAVSVALCDFVVDNSGSLTYTANQVEHIFFNRMRALDV